MTPLRCIAIALTYLLLAAPSSAEEAGFTPLFDGRSLSGWEGNREMFRVEDGAIVGGSLNERIPQNEFLCTEKEYGDFELRLQAKPYLPAARKRTCESLLAIRAADAERLPQWSRLQKIRRALDKLNCTCV